MQRPVKADWHPETIAVHAGVYKDTTFNSVTTPIYATSTFAFEQVGVHKGFDYSRSGNPTRKALEENLAALEGGVQAWATCTGMAAFTTLAFLFQPGDHIVTGYDIYAGTFRLLDQVLRPMGVQTTFVHMDDPDEVRRAIHPTTKALLIETPSNPLLNLVDIAAMAAIAKERGLFTIADNTFMSPYCQNPFALGVDIIVPPAPPPLRVGPRGILNLHRGLIDVGRNDIGRLVGSRPGCPERKHSKNDEHDDAETQLLAVLDEQILKSATLQFSQHGFHGDPHSKMSGRSD